MGFLTTNEQERVPVDPELVGYEMRYRLQNEVEPIVRRTKYVFPFLANLLSSMTGSVAVAREWAKSKVDQHRPPLHLGLEDRDAAETAQTMALGNQLGLHSLNLAEIVARNDEMAKPDELSEVTQQFGAIVDTIPHANLASPDTSNVVSLEASARQRVEDLFNKAA